MSRSTGKRPRRAGERIRQLVAETLERDLSDPRLELVTITDVRTSPDVKTATVFWTVLDRRKVDAVAQALESARGAVQRRVGAGLGTRNTPLLTFTFDELQDRANALTTLIEGLDRPPEGSGGT